ncbi:MAG: extracellular solute-binding protein [Bifidobacteriaceae bacterium]|jgi:ABC-type glycerol-3-phosphate transport system substrate-binding protein|nr:extracellular solute-binding protein [Bifidobacteriaceae bacterium]
MVAVTASLVGACSSGSTGGGSDGGDLSGQTITVIDAQGHPQFNEVWDKIPEFTKETGIEVNLILNDTQTIRQKVLSALQLNQDTYDVVTLPNDTVSAAGPYLADLNGFLGDDSAFEKFQSQQPGWAQEKDLFEGKLRYLPFYAGGYGVAYRTDLLEDAANQAAFEAEFGHAMQVPPESPESLLELVQFFNDPPNRYGIVVPGQGETGRNVLEELIFRSGLTWQENDGTAGWGPGQTDAQERVATAAAYLQDLVWKHGAAPKELTGMATDGAAAFFNNCQAAMYMDLIYLSWSKIKESESKCGPVSSFRVPPFTSDAGEFISFWMHSIPESSKHKEAAWKFLEWLHSEENLGLAVASPNGTFVPTDAMVAEKAVGEGVLPDAVVDAVGEGTAFLIDGNTSAIRLALDSPYDKLMANQISPADFAASSGEAIAKIVEGSS